MKLATLKSKDSRDGRLIVVSSDNKTAVEALGVAKCLREAVESWSKAKPQLEDLARELNAGRCKNSFALKVSELHSPLPRSFQWADGSAFLHHVKLVRKARNAPLPETLFTVPLMYQGGSDTFLSPTDDIAQIDVAHGTDFEGEFAVVTDDVPMGVSAEAALNHIVLVMTVNDVSLRGLIPEELAAGFGFFQSKPSSAFSPLAVTIDELGSAWSQGRVNLPLIVRYNGKDFGKANGSEMHFHFGQLIAHAARTRALAAGTIVGSGTVSNEDPSRGSSCLAEKRMIEQINEGKITTPFMKPGDRIEIEVLDEKGRNIFGTIDQKVVKK